MLLRKIFSFPTLTLLVALTLSAIAAWYSILGLTAIFAAAVIPIMIMGGSLEIAKVVTTVWLHRYWDRAGWKLKAYLIPAVIALAFLTSMGIFGFLSKAHSDQSLISGDVQSKVEIYDEKIAISKDNIEANRKALQQMDSQVDQLLGRTTDDVGANRAVQVRRQQATERKRLTDEIALYQAEINKLNEEAAPIRAEIRKVEAEVGPIKYIAALIYGDNPDNNLLERAVRWVIILIVFVFDPLALTLVLAAQSSYRWLNEDLKNKRKETISNEENEETKVDEFLEESTNEILHEVPYEVKNQEDISSNQVDFEETEPELVKDENVDLNINDQPSTKIHKPVQSTRPIETEGVTLPESDGGYILYEGKSVSKSALKQMQPELFKAKPDENKSDTSFGIAFPRIAKKGDIFVRVDLLPNRVYKFDGKKWIEINKENTDSYLYDDAYIKYLVEKIENGEYDIELLSDNEKAQIEEFLQKGN